VSEYKGIRREGKQNLMMRQEFMVACDDALLNVVIGFVGKELGMTEEICDQSNVTRNSSRLIGTKVARSKPSCDRA